MKLALFIFGLIIAWLLIGFVVYIILGLIDETLLDNENIVTHVIIAWPTSIIGFVIVKIYYWLIDVNITHHINCLVKKIVKFIKRKR